MGQQTSRVCGVAHVMPGAPVIPCPNRRDRTWHVCRNPPLITKRRDLLSALPLRKSPDGYLRCLVLSLSLPEPGRTFAPTLLLERMQDRLRRSRTARGSAYKSPLVAVKLMSLRVIALYLRLPGAVRYPKRPPLPDFLFSDAARCKRFACAAHNREVAGSNPAAATNLEGAIR